MRFMVITRFAQQPTEEALALIPAETARGNELQAQGIRTNLYVAEDYSAAWQIFQAETRDDVERAVASLPLHPYVETTLSPLADEMN